MAADRPRAQVETELAKLAVKESQDVATLRGRLEELDRTLYRAERDLKAKAEAHRAAPRGSSRPGIAVADLVEAGG